MRIFGYNVQNGYYKHDVFIEQNSSELMYLRNQSNDETDDNDDNSKKNPYTEHTFLDEARAKTFRICLYILSKRVEDYYLAGPSLKRDKFGKGMQRYIATNDIKIKEIEFEPTKRIQVKAYNKMIDEDYTDLPYLEKPELVKMHSKVNDRICDVVEYIEKFARVQMSQIALHTIIDSKLILYHPMQAFFD